MKNQKYLAVTAASLVVVFLAYIVYANAHKTKKPVDPAFKEYISAYTSGAISCEAPVRIRLASDVAKPEQLNTPVAGELFSFSPSVEGNAVWTDARTIEFRPSKKMKAGEEYIATFRLGSVMKVPDRFKEFEFSFQVIQQSFEVAVLGLRPLDKRVFDRQVLLGSLTTADVAEVDQVEKVLTAQQGGRSLPIRWEHKEGRIEHNFFVDSIVRGEDSSTVVLSWTGSPLAIKLSGQRTVTVPAIGHFTLTNATVVMETTEQYLLLEFSDPILETQNLQGLIRLNNNADLKFTIEDNLVRVYPSVKQTGTFDVIIDAAVKNSLGKPLNESVTRTITFEELKPAVRLSGKGVILPGSEGLLFPFEAVSLNAVDVRIVKIYENNVEQFLQVNTLDGEQELTRVGRVVLKKTIPLSSIKQTDLSRWNQYALDLAELVKVDPGSIYRVTIGFKKKYSLYGCTQEDTSTTNEKSVDDMPGNWDESAAESSNWDFVEDYYSEGYDWEGYDWDQRENPCQKSYYTPNRFVSRNMLASNIGLLAKGGSDGSMLFTVTSLVTAQPISDVTLEVYTLQRQLIQRLQSGGDGTASITVTDKKPFLVIAKKGAERGYLKLDDGSSLSLSMFDVAGQQVQKGVKGFIYGERGVWRPGDSLFLTFMLEDKQKTLPANYPVSFELFNPRGQLARKIVRSQPLNGFYSFNTNTDAEAPTGNWEARVRVGNATFSKTLRIETVMPNRLKIKFDIPNKYLAKDDHQNAKMEVQWLTGANAGNLNTIVEATLAASKTTFPKYNNYSFDDPTRKFSADKQIVFDGKLDATGKASVPMDIKVEEAAPGMLQANFSVRAFEPGGNASIDRFSMPYHPYTTYTGIMMPAGDKARGMLLTDTNHIVRIATVDRNGNPTTGTRKVEVEFYKVQWRWWWDRSEEAVPNFNNSSYTQLRKRDTITTVNGQGTWTLRLNYPDWGRFLVRTTDLESKHAAGKVVYMDWPGWAGRPANDQAGATMLSFSANKETYVTGEEATLTIPSSNKGRALVTVESGTRVLKNYWVECAAGQTQFKFPVTPDMAPNVYVSVTLLQPHAQTLNDLPIRMYGIIPLLVENPGTHITPVIKMKDVLQPLENVTVNVSEQKGKAMTYTIAVVDDGLLDLTRFKTPDPWANFYAREALGVKTWDMFDYVMGAWGSKMDRVLAVGGDEGLSKPKDGNKANRFKPVVMFMGPYHIDKGQTRSHTFQMPQYVGSVRTMVVAGESNAYGWAEKTTPVRKPLMVLATLPRVLGPGEAVDLPVTVFAMEKNIKDVTVEIMPNDMLEVEGGKTRSIKFNSIGDEVLTFRVKVKPQLGMATVKVIARSGNEKAETAIELDVRNPNPRITEISDTVLQPGQTWKGVCKPVGIAGTNKATIEVSSVPPLNLGNRLNYLLHYPYGCVEQTTSSVFPQLYLSDVLDMSTNMKAVAENNIRAGIQRLKLFQVASGGLSYWPGETYEDDWATNYAGHFMVAAEKKGYAMPAGFMDGWKKYQRNRASTWNGTNDQEMRTQAYRLYTLALAKSADLGSMNRLRENKNLSIMAKWSLASAYQLAGQPEVAKQLTANLPLIVADYRDLGGTYGSDERDEAIILEALSLMGKTEQGMELMKRLSASLCSKEYMSTQTTAYTLMAMSEYLGKTGKGSGMNFSYQVAGAAQQGVSTQSAIRQVPVAIKGVEEPTISISNTGKNLLYVRIIREGIPKTGDISSTASNLEMKVTYYNMDNAQIDPAQLKQGTDFYAEVQVTNPGKRGLYQQMALNQIFPSGWEILNQRMDQPEGTTTKTSVARYQDIRDDRVYTYYDLKPKETKTFRTYLNASYLGTFYLAPVYSEAMYDGSITARMAGKWVSVTPQGAGKEESKK